MGLKILNNLTLFCKFFEAKEISFKSPILFKLPSIGKRRRKKANDKKFNDSSISSILNCENTEKN
jgi:hypothetical protein